MDLCNPAFDALPALVKTFALIGVVACALSFSLVVLANIYGKKK
jgi:hypothetical protein